jgi:signal transduction histidine kinase
VLLAFSVVAVAFVGVAGWGVVALRAAADQSRLVRVGYLPLTRALRDLVTLQDTWNAQLNHITTARNPADARIWFDAALHLGRPKKFNEVRAAITLAFARSNDPSIRALGRDLLAEVKWVERSLQSEPDLLKSLFESLSASDAARAERYRDRLLKRGLSTHRRLSNLDRRVLGNVDTLSIESSEQELFAVRLLIGLSVLTALIGVVMAFYVRRVLRPLEHVTRRARDVAGGDFSPRDVVSTGDEIGELALAFERMVQAIATMKEQMLSSDRLATIGKMAAHVTHEIRNPLSSMALNVELLEDELSSDATEARALLSAVQKELGRLTQLTEQYLSIARHRQVKIEVEDMAAVVREAISFLERDLSRRKVQVIRNLPEEPVWVALDEMQLRQALFNLLRNADEAMPEGGRIHVGLRVLEAGEGNPLDETIDVELAQVRRAMLTVRDEGSGIDRDMAAKIFEPFVTTKMTGTGLGLAVTRQIVEGHHGKIACVLPKEGGACFVLVFPCVAEDPSPPSSGFGQLVR